MITYIFAFNNDYVNVIVLIYMYDNVVSILNEIVVVYKFKFMINVVINNMIKNIWMLIMFLRSSTIK